MAYGAGWQIEESERYRSSYEAHIAGNAELEDLFEIFYWAFLEDPLDPLLLTMPVSGTFRFAKVPGPPAFLVFYEIDPAQQLIMLDFLTPDLE